MAFNYGQKGIQELATVEKFAPELGWNKPIFVDMLFMAELWPKTQLTDEKVKVEDSYASNVVVPIRNAVMLTIATAYAYSIGAKRVIYGAHMSDVGKGDHPLYPDCTPEFTLALETALRIGHFRNARDIEIRSPAMLGLTKVDLIKAGYKLLGDNLFQTWSCYLSREKQCGICESCRNRRAAFKAAGIEDKTEYFETEIYRREPGGDTIDK
jgi:7-cyano-7-deazaguanine synthase